MHGGRPGGFFFSSFFFFSCGVKKDPEQGRTSPSSAGGVGSPGRRSPFFHQEALSPPSQSKPFFFPLLWARPERHLPPFPPGPGSEKTVQLPAGFRPFFFWREAARPPPSQFPSSFFPFPVRIGHLFPSFFEHFALD